MKEIIFVTSNKGKIETAKNHLNGSVNIMSYNYDIDEPEVNDIEYIAEFKVKEAYKKVQKPCVSLDAGFYIPEFPNCPNFPGAFPKRELLNKLGIDGLLEKMKNVPNRECYFKECLAYFDGENFKKFFGYVHGFLATEKHGHDSNEKWSDLWYVFIPDNNTKTMAEMTDEERANRNDGYICPFDKFKEWFTSLSE